MASGLKQAQKGLSSSQLTLNNTRVEEDKERNLATQIANTEATTQALLSELALYTNDFTDPLKQVDPELNGIQKLLNLKANQGVIGSALNIINRPAEGLQGALTAALNPASGEEIVSNMLKGISGKEEYQFADLGIDFENPFINGVAGMSFEMLIDPLNFVNQPFKLLSTKGKDVFKTVKNKAEQFFAKSDVGTAAYGEFTEVMNKAGTQFKKVFNTWKDPALKNATNTFSNLNNALARGKEDGAALIVNLMKVSEELPKQMVKEWNSFPSAEMSAIKETLGLSDDWIPTQELTQLVKKTYDNPEEFSQLFKGASKETRESFTELSNASSRYLSKVKESAYPHGENISDVLSGLSSPKFVSQAEKGFDGTMTMIRSDAFTDVAAKTRSQFVKSEPFLFLKDVLEKASGKKLVDGIPKTLDEISLDTYMEYQSGVGRYLFDNTNSLIPSPAGGYMTSYSKQGGQMWLTEAGKSLVSQYQRNIKNSQLSKAITHNYVGEESKYLIDLINYGEIKFAPDYIDAVKNMVEPLKALYKRTTGKDLKFVTAEDSGQLVMKIAPDPKYGVDFIPEQLNDMALDNYSSILQKDISTQIERVHKAESISRDLQKEIANLKEYDVAINSVINTPAILGKVFETLQKKASKADLKPLEDNIEFVNFVNNAESGMGSTAPFAPSDASVKFVNGQLLNKRQEFVNVSKRKVTYHWDKLETGVSQTSFPMDIVASKMSTSEKMNFVAYLRDRGIINDDTMTAAGFEKWTDFKDPIVLNNAFESGIIPQSLSVKVAGMTGKMDTSNGYINLAQWNKLGATPTSSISTKKFVNQVEKIHKDILSGKLLSQENIVGLYKQFNLNDTRENIISALSVEGNPTIQQLITDMRRQKSVVSKMQSKYTRATGKIVDQNIEAKVLGASVGNAIFKRTLNKGVNLVQQTAKDVRKVGIYDYVASKKVEIDGLTKRIESLSFQQVANSKPVLPADLIKLQNSNIELYKTVTNSNFKRNGRYDSIAIIDNLVLATNLYSGIQKLPGGAWEFVTKSDIENFKKTLTPFQLEKIIPFGSADASNLFQSVTLQDVRHNWFTRELDSTINAQADANAEMIYALNPGTLGLDLTQINYLKSQNYAKSANAMLNEISIGNISFAVKKQTKLQQQAQNKVKAWTNLKNTIDTSTTKVDDITKDVAKTEKEITKLEKAITKGDSPKLKEKLTKEKEVVNKMTDKYNDAVEKYKSFKDNEVVAAKDKYQEVKLDERLFTRKVKEQNIAGKIKKAEKHLAKVKSEYEKKILTKELKRWNADKAVLDAEIIAKQKLTKLESRAYKKVKKQQERLKQRYMDLSAKKSNYIETNGVNKIQKDINEIGTKNAALKKAKSTLIKQKKDLVEQQKLLDKAIADSQDFEKTREGEIETATSNIETAKGKKKEYAKVEYQVKKRRQEEYIKQLNQAGDKPVNGLMNQLTEGMDSPIHTFYNPLSSASPHFIAKEYLAGQKHDLTMVADLLTNRKNIRMVDSVYAKLPEVFESTINRFLNVDQAVYGFMGRFIQDSTGISIKSWEVEGYMRHMLNADEAVIKILRDSASGYNSSVTGQIFGTNAKKMLMAREYQGSAFDVNAAFGTELFNTNPVQATAMALDLFPNSFKKTATLKSLVDNKLITSVSSKEYAGFNPTRTEGVVERRIADLETKIARNKEKGKQNNRYEDLLIQSQDDLKSVQTYKKIDTQLSDLKEKAFNTKAQQEFDEIKLVQEQKLKEYKDEMRLVLDDPKQVAAIQSKIDETKKALKDGQEIVDAGKLKGEELSASLVKMEQMKNRLQELIPKITKADTRDFVNQQKWLEGNPQFKGAPGEWAIMDEANIKSLEQAIDLIYKVDPKSLDESDWGKTLKDLIDNIRSNGQQNVIHKGALDIIETFGKSSTSSGMSSVFNTIQKYIVSPWKTSAIFTAGFHTRNILTNVVNSHLFGMNTGKVFKNATKYNADLIKFHKDLKSLEVATATGKWRTSDEQSEMVHNLMFEQDVNLRNAFFEQYDALDIAKLFEVNEETSRVFADMMDMSAKGIVGNNQLNGDVLDQALAISRAAKGKGPKFKQEFKGGAGAAVDFGKKAIAMSYNLSKRIDDGFKIGTYKYLNDLDPTKAEDLKVIERLANMGFAKKLQKEDGSFDIVYRKGMDKVPEIDAEAATKFVGFDYNNLSNTEHTLMKSIFPFYTWARKNVEFQMKNILHNDNRYRQLFKALKGWRRAFVDDDEEYEYQENYIPVWSSNGTVQYLKFSIPFFEADEIISGGGIINGLSPIFKAPLEMITGFDFFTKREIESNQNPGFGLGLSNIFGTAKVLGDMLFNDYSPTYEDKKLAGIIGKKIMDFVQIGKNLFSMSSLMESDGAVNSIASLFPSIFSKQQLATVRYQNALLKKKRAEEALEMYKSRR